MENKSSRHIYESMVNAASMYLDMETILQCKPYPITFGFKLSCDDGTRHEVALVIGEWEGKSALLFWTIMDGKYVEDFICYIEDKNWFDNLLSNDIKEQAHAIIEGIAKGGQVALEKRINEEGIENIHSLVLTEKFIKRTMKLPYSCAISFYGLVVAGVKEIEEYCQNQKESSSPYILKRFHDVTFGDDGSGEVKIVRCTNYLICKDAKSAETWVKEFVVLGSFSVFSEDIPNSYNRPTMLLYADGMRYMLLNSVDNDNFY